jgi:hypothetical protein
VENVIAMGNLFRKIVGERFKHGWNEIPGYMMEAGLTSVASDIVSSDRLPETREKAAIVAQRLAFASARMMTDRNAPGSMTSAELDRMQNEVAEDIRSGAYFRYDIHVVYGRKPVE